MTERSTSPCEPRRALALVIGLGGLFLASCGPRPLDDSIRPPPAEASVIHAQGLLRLGDPAGALDEVAVVLDDQGTHLWAHRVAQDALIALGRREQALQTYLDLTAEYPEEAAFAYLAGRVQLPDRDAARPHFEDAVRLEPTLAWGHVGLAQLEVLDGDMFQAIQIHKTALDARPDDADLQMSLGFLTLELRLLRDAQAAFRRALRERPWDPRLLGGLGQTLGQLDSHGEAIEVLELALAIDPSRTDLMGSLAFVYYSQGDLEAAWRTCQTQQEVDASADPHLKWALEAELDRTMPHFAVLGPRYLDRVVEETTE